MRHLRNGIYFLVFLLISQSVHSAVCSSVFSNVLGSTDDEIEIKDDVKLINTGNRVLQAKVLDQDRSNHCDNAKCIASEALIAEINFAKRSVKTDLKKISKTFVAGDYYYDDVEFKNTNKLTVSGLGQVRIHVRDDLKIKDQAAINEGGDASQLVFIVYDDVEIKDKAEVNAIIYARDKLTVKDDAQIIGAFVGSNIEVKDDAKLTYSVAKGLAIPSLCTGGDGNTDSGDTPTGKLDFKVEVGALTVINTYDKPEFTRVNFTQEFSEPPAVFTLPTTQGGNAAAHRIRNITVNGFDIMTLEPIGEDGPHVSMALNYLAIEKGTHELPNGKKIRVDVIPVSKSQSYKNVGSNVGWETVYFSSGFKAIPAVLAQVQSMNNEQEKRLPSKPSKPWLTTAVSNVSASKMSIALERSDSTTGNVTRSEDVAYLAAEPEPRMSFEDSNGTSILMEILRSSPLVKGWSTCNQASTRVPFARVWDVVPIALASMNTRGGDASSGEGDGGWFRRCKTSKEYVSLVVDEVKSSKLGDKNRTHDVAERAGMVMFSGNFVMESKQLDHYRLIHDGKGIVGLDEEVTIQVCKNADCSELYTDPVTVTLKPGDSNTSWAGDGVLANQVTFSGGSKTVQLIRKISGKFSLSLESTPVANNAMRCYIGSNQSCAIEYIETTFEVVVPDQVSATQSLGSISLPSCFDAFKSQKVQLNLSNQYLIPASSGLAVYVNNVSLPLDGSESKVTLSFDENCTAPITIEYDDAGQIQLSALYKGTGDWAGLELKGSHSMVFYPAMLKIEAHNLKGVKLNATTPTATPTHAAAEDFLLKVSAINAEGNVTQAYSPQAANRISAYLRRIGPLGGASVDGFMLLGASSSIRSKDVAAANNGEFSTVSILPSDFSSGVYQYANASYNEVGIVALDLIDLDYFGHKISASETTIGRFSPHSFTASSTIYNRALSPACTGSDYSYFSEAIELDVYLQAISATGADVENYLGDYMRLPTINLQAFGSGAANTLGLRDGGTGLSDRISIQTTSFSSWSAGGATMNILFDVAKDTNEDGPYENAVIAFSLIDNDGVGVNSLDLDLNLDAVSDHKQIATTKLRYGRIALANAHGSELNDLDIPIVVQYYAGASVGFVTNTSDDCSEILSLTISDLNLSDGLAVSETCFWDDAGNSGANACVGTGPVQSQYQQISTSGVFRAALKAAGSNNVGNLLITADVPDWSKYKWDGISESNPTGQATFGIYNRDTNVIYQREWR